MSASDRVKVGVLGATGYSGIEAVRILAAHPFVELSVLTSENYAGREIADVYRHLRGIDLPPLEELRPDLSKSRADVFLSADTNWMDYGIQKKVIKDDGCFFLLGNTLVLIASKDSKLGNVTIKPGFNLAQLAGNGLIAIGDVQAVPVGIYAKEALEKLGSWDAAAAKFTMTQDVRAALALVAQGVASLGIVYATDAKVEPRVKVIGTFPGDSHRAIIYPVAATVTAKLEADTYLSYLRSTAATKAVFDKYGFIYLWRRVAC